jgi:hypothetical protein
MPLDDLDAHEHRIQRLEEVASDLKATQAEVNTNLRYLGDKVDSSMKAVTDKIDLVLKPLAEKLEGHLAADEKAHGELIEVAAIAKRLDEKELVRAQRWNGWKKALGTVTLGAAAIGLKELVAFIVRHIP